MKDSTIVSAAVLIAILALAAFVYSNPKNERVCLNDKCFSVEAARTYEERAKGLMFRENLDQDKGMLFIFEKEGDYPFWMKNTLIPLDMVWMDSDKYVVYVKKNAEPCKTNICPNIEPGRDALYVLELNSGAADAIGLSVGDYMTFSAGV